MLMFGNPAFLVGTKLWKNDDSMINRRPIKTMDEELIFEVREQIFRLAEYITELQEQICMLKDEIAELRNN